MRTFWLMRGIWLLPFLFCTGLLAGAQTHGFRFFPVKDLPLLNQGFVGKIGTHFILLNRANAEELDMYVYDTVSQTGKRKAYRFPRQVLSITVGEKSVTFIGVAPGKEGMLCHYIELDERGEILKKKETPISLLVAPMRAVNSSDQKHTLLYQYVSKGLDSSFVQGSVVGTDGTIQKQLAYSFKHDRERDDQPEFTIDNDGNTHILVFDKYDSYRISTDLTLNTILFDKEEITSETFNLQKVKLKTMGLFQNADCNCMQAEGLYTDGTQKVTQGLYTINFPTNRRSQLAPVFIPFDKDMIKGFKKGFSATEATIRNSLQLQEMVYSESGSFAVMRLSVDLLQQPGKKFTDNGRYALPRSDISAGRSVVVSRSTNWSAPKLIYVKLNKGQGIQWQTTKTLDVFNFSDNMYNRVFLVGAEQQEILTVLYQADKLDEPEPILLSMKDGKQSIEKFPEKKMVFSPVQLLAARQYGSLYLNIANGEGGIMFIEPNK